MNFKVYVIFIAIFLKKLHFKFKFFSWEIDVGWSLNRAELKFFFRKIIKIIDNNIYLKVSPVNSLENLIKRLNWKLWRLGWVFNMLLLSLFIFFIITLSVWWVVGRLNMEIYWFQQFLLIKGGENELTNIFWWWCIL